MRSLIAALLVLAACGASSTSDDPRVQVADISLAPPPDWLAEERGTETRLWAPKENPRRESIAVVIGPRYPSGAAHAFAATQLAQQILQDVKVASSGPITTTSGVPGMRFDLTFRPDSVKSEVYTRAHVVLFIGDGVDGHTVHLMYTAADPDADGAMFARIVASVAKGA